MQEAIICKNCGNQFAGNYCNHCGEKVYTDHDKTFAHFLEEGFHFLTHFDNKFFKSWWLAMTKPGFISTRISAGVRKPYFKPFSLFLVGVLLYLLFPFFPGLNIPLKFHRNEKYAAISRPMIEKKMRSKNLTLEELAVKFDAKSPKFAKVLLLVIIPLSAFALQLLFFGSRKYYFDHLTLSAEINTFFLYFVFFIIPLIATVAILVSWLFAQKGSFYIGDAIIEPVYLTIFGIYCTVSFRRFYGAKLIKAILKSALFLAAHWLIVYLLYRLILFCLVLLFI